jgi:hypothetical protein
MCEGCELYVIGQASSSRSLSPGCALGFRVQGLGR